MSTAAGSRGRTRPNEEEYSSEEEDSSPNSTTFCDYAKGAYRSRVDRYASQADWPEEPLYSIGEVVYLSVPGQSQPSGPYVIVSNDNAARTYTIKRADNGQIHPSAVGESSLRVKV